MTMRDVREIIIECFERFDTLRSYARDYALRFDALRFDAPSMTIQPFFLLLLLLLASIVIIIAVHVARRRTSRARARANTDTNTNTNTNPNANTNTNANANARTPDAPMPPPEANASSHDRMDLGNGHFLEQFTEQRSKNGAPYTIVKIGNGLTEVRFKPDSIVKLLREYESNGGKSVESGRVALLVAGNKLAFRNSYRSTIEISKKQFELLLKKSKGFEWVLKQ
jgi:hypothetical protein